MKITTFVLGLLRNNTYIVENQEEKTCFIVDPSTESNKLTDYITEIISNLKGYYSPTDILTT